MGDLLSLFDGGFNAGGSGGTTTQNASPSPVSSENALLARFASGTDGVVPLVDYSNFANFVTFNSANSLVTITADQVLNQYPYGGGVDVLQAFLDGLDGYQNYFLNLWPAWSGHLRLNPAVSSSYVTVADFGIDDSGVARSSFVSPGTGSISIQAWLDVPVLTGSNDTMVLFQKLGTNGADGVTVYMSGSAVHFLVVSGSTSVDVSGALLTPFPSFVSAVCDRSAPTGSVEIFLGTSGSYPTLAATASIILGARFDLGSGSFSIASGSLAGKNVVAFTGSIDSLSVWSVPQTLVTLSGSYNRKTFAQSGLTAIWRFNDASPSTPTSWASVIRDFSGHRLDGKAVNFFSGSRGSGSLIADSPDPILTLLDPNVFSYIVNAQTTGILYDRGNPSMFLNLFPAAFADVDGGGDVFQNFALAVARHFDRIKVMIDQLVQIQRVKFGSFDQVPDDLLEDLGAFLGWQLDANFIDADVLRYFLGRSVVAGPLGNVGLNKKLNQIKVEFWRRALRDVMYLHKTRGTAESVNALLNIYGANSGFVRLKEYAKRVESRPTLERVVSQKAVWALQFVSGSSVTLTL